MSGSGISWAICNSAPCYRQITTPEPHHSVFTGRMPFLPPNQQRQSTDCQLSTVRNHTLLFQITQYSQVALFLPHQLLNCLIQTVPSDERQQVVFSYWNKKSLSWAKLFSDIVPKVMDIQYTRCSHCTVHTAQCTHNTLRRIIAADMKSELWLCANRCGE